MLKVINPTTGQRLHEYPALNPADMNARIAAAENAFRHWRQQSIAQRAEVLNRVATLMRDQETELARLMTLEMGKPVKEARGEVQKAAWCAEHYAAHAADYLASVTLNSDASSSYVQHLPLGPVLGILPWNAPFWLAFRFCAPALMAGNTCLMKHDPHVPACAEAIADLFVQAEAPAGILQNLPLTTSSVESAIRHRAVRAVSFTGSSAAGSRVAALAAAELKPAVLELGGSDPAIVLKDADLEAAADAIVLSRIINAGQSCIAAKRIIVEAPVHERFVELLKDRLEKLRLGDPSSVETDIGPIAREDLRAELARQVDETIAAGAECLLGGQMPEGEGFFYPVTLLTEVNNQMTACREETFGPVAVVLRANSAEHALQIANDTEYGLAASIWTNRQRGEALAQEIEAGQVVVNGLVKTDPRLPSGGIKRSGYGRELGPHGIMEFVNVQQVWVGPKQE
ncbi:NAD-dependent succinate-semialdehyde dehydrogenase [Marinobacterium sediminicola]|uniref:Succinate-semialdehyde dehydrogenase / glutarate-semialdehyde dehydrogenase n=1 Tax=Marinobacterium sediminicola TaxID=518898 RepID=A0ABY1S0W4_9GAMM|nr:NAD-dependent succinate-semialdehyde dehydrogenase [Marinobacterium sediminicola]ULG70092.1 NAD-dependent succinate-semialdehyde dehydrogenase [Marinobacterium sediminicola]SMR74906.1 succinate-semialdehyde dehydrogenase / glutarate-semialdehyde dehydrogenase [Marinobacterium sediminicola]